MAVWKFGLAIAAGNTVVFKSSDPFSTATALSRSCNPASLPTPPNSSRKTPSSLL
ncbi:hypothetical protein [Corynebacterium durum]|uniref:hypothetical protein n=1 Tax=Corynebacterium durum TaxID=61592 RepID=UPI00389A7FC8